jgi:hypothetical protein
VDREDPRVLEYVRQAWEADNTLSHGKLAKRVNTEFGLSFSRDAFKNWALRRKLKPPTSKMPQDDIAAAKEELVSRAKHAAERQDTRRKAAVELLIDAFREIAPQMPPLPKVGMPKLHVGPYPEEEAILTLSDVHGGETLDAEETGGLASFDWDALMVYAATLLTKIKAIVPRHNYRLPVLHVHSLGDILTGLDIYPGQWNYAAFEEVEQVFRCAELLTWMLLELLTVFPRIVFKGVYGNHGRIGKKGERRPFNNWDYMIYKMVEMRIQSCPEIAARVTFEIPKTWWLLTEIKGWRYLLMHGEDIRGWGGFPHYGAARMARNWMMILTQLGASKRLLELAGKVGPFHELECGHHHMPYYTNDTGLRLWFNGAWPGGSMLSLKGMGRYTPPCQNFRGVSDASSTSWYYDLQLGVPLEGAA